MNIFHVNGLGKTISLGVTDIDGEQFLISVPPISVWRKFQSEFLNKSPVFQLKWKALSTENDIKRVFCQGEFKDKSCEFRIVLMSLPAVIQDIYTVYPQLCDQDAISPSLLFVPYLIPLKNFVELDKVPIRDEMQQTEGSTLYLSDIPVKQTATDFCTTMLESRDVVGKLKMGDSYDYDTVLPWIQIEHGYLCGKPLMYNTSFLELSNLFL